MVSFSFCMMRKSMGGSVMVKRILFWIRECVIRKDRACRHFCGSCKYYEICSQDAVN